MIDLDIAEFSLGVAESTGDKSVSVNCAMMLELITRLRQAEKDAARYRWLRDVADEFDINDFFMCSQVGEKRNAFADEAMQCSGDNK